MEATFVILWTRIGILAVKLDCVEQRDDSARAGEVGPMDKLRDLIRILGVLRVMLLVVVMWFVASAPFAGDEVAYSGWSMVPKLVVPVLVPIAFFVLPMDITMSRIMMSDKEGQARDRYKVVIILDVVLLVLLLVAWLPYFMRLLRI